MKTYIITKEGLKHFSAWLEVYLFEKSKSKEMLHPSSTATRIIEVLRDPYMAAVILTKNNKLQVNKEDFDFLDNELNNYRLDRDNIEINIRESKEELKQIKIKIEVLTRILNTFITKEEIYE